MAMTEVLEGTCQCGQRVRIQTGGFSREDLIEKLGESRSYTCNSPTFPHVEHSGINDYVTWDAEVAQVEIVEPVDPRTHLSELREEYGEDSVFFTGCCDWAEEEGLQDLRTVEGLRHVGFGDFQDPDGSAYLRINDPSGIRFYVRSKREVAA